VLCPALLLGAATVWELGAAYRRAQEVGLSSTAEALATAVDRDVEIAVTALSTLATSPALASDDIPALYTQAAAVGRAFGGWVAMLEADSRQVFNTLRPLGADLPRGSGDRFVAQAIATGRPAMSDLFLGATARRPVISVFQPLPAGPSGSRRVLLLAFSPERLAALLARQRLGDQGGFAVLTDGRNQVVARSSEHERFVSRASPDWYVQAVSGQDRGLVHGGASLAGFRGVLAFARLENAPSWIVAVITPFGPYQGQWQGRPLRTLASDAGRLARGGVPTSLEPERIAEVEVLRQALWRSVSALHAQGAAEGRARAAEEAASELREAAAELHEAARRRDLLVRELNHRVKNMLATVQSLAAQTLKGTRGNPEQFVHDFSGRMRTLAQAHDLLTASNWEGAEMGMLVEAVLAPWRVDGRISISGPPDLHVSVHQAQALVLALHELATNAVKYGALSVSRGRVDVRWWVSHSHEAARLELRWHEHDGPLVEATHQQGFGSRLLERGLPRQIKGGARLSLRPEGAEYHLWAPLNASRHPDARRASQNEDWSDSQVAGSSSES
jgi:two-component sensor histidine kinase